MATWAEFAAAAPEMAETGWGLLSHPGFGYGYLATVRRDGGPRLHPVTPVLAAGRLMVFVVPSPKLADLRRDGRYALHSSGAEHVNDEFGITGRAAAVTDPALGRAALEACHFTPGGDHVLMELGLDSALWAHYATPPSWPPRYTTWKAS